MLYLRMSDLLLSPPVTHLKSDWQVARDLKFTNIAAQSIGDAVNLTSILLTTQLDPGVKYYARSRAMLSTGYTAWSNIDIFTPQDVLAKQTQTLLPSLVSIPTISISTGPNGVSVYNSTITVGAVSTLGGAQHTASTYMIEDMQGNIVWLDLANKANLNSINIPPGYLEPDRAYRLRVMIHVDSMDTSQLITQTFRTEPRSGGLIATTISNIDSTALNVVGLNAMVPVGTNATIYALINNEVIPVVTLTAAGAVISIPANSLKPATKYLMRVTTSSPALWDQVVFNTL